MAADVAIRPLEARDVAAAQRVAWAALREQIPVEQHPADEAQHVRHGRGRIAHLLATDPSGAWAAEHGGEVVGIALALVREGIWGLSLLAVAPPLQGRGIGGRLLSAALTTADGARGGIILSTTDPRAMRRYHRAGFALRPCVAAGGQINRARLPAGLRARTGDLVADAELLAACARHVRGAAYGPDLDALRQSGGELLVVDGRGFAIHREGTPALLAARDDGAARDLVLSCLAAGPAGGTVHVDFVTAGNDWAVTAALDAGLALMPDGPMFVRGVPGPLTPFLPNGAYL